MNDSVNTSVIIKHENYTSLIKILHCSINYKMKYNDLSDYIATLWCNSIKKYALCPHKYGGQ